MSLLNLTSAQLTKAANLAGEIERLNAELSELFGSPALVPAPTTAAASVETVRIPGKRGPKKGGMSAEGRARIAAAQRARWTKVNAGKVESAKSAAPAKKRTMSAAGRAAIQAAQRARWAKVKAAKRG